MFGRLVPRVFASKPTPSRRRRGARRLQAKHRRQLGAESLESRRLLASDPIVTVDTNFGNFQLDLFASTQPKTVANFLGYVNTGDFNNIIISRSVANFVIQGGGAADPGGTTTFSGSSSQFTAVPDLTTSNGGLPSEAGISNTTGTIAMALSNGPNTGTNQWFINLQNNPILDGTSDGGPFTVFGKVIGNGMQAVNTIAALPTKSVTSTVPSVDMSNLPVSSSNQLVVISSMSVDSIDGTVFSDTNGDGQMDNGETGVAGRTVFIDKDGSGVPDANNPSTTTDANGNYTFSGLTAGSYTVREVLPAGIALSTPTQTVTVASDQTTTGVNFGETAASTSLSATVAHFSPTQGTAFTGAVATFSDSNTADTAAGFNATINWGDGNSSTGTISGSAGAFTVSGTHTYSEDGTNTVSVGLSQVKPGTAQTSASGSVFVTDGDLTGTGVTISATQGTSFSSNLATFTDPDDPTASAGTFAATIDWGDGTTSSGSVSGSSGTFTVSGTHTYSDGGAFAVKVGVGEGSAGSTPSATIDSLANVPDTDTLTATGAATFTQTEGQTPNVTIATFTDSNLATPASDFIASIDWGDGGSTTSGTVTGSNGQFTVTASHLYASEGTFTVHATVADDAPVGATATAATTATVSDGDVLTPSGITFAATEGANFVGTVATFNDAITSNNAADFNANIDWGDGITSVGTVSGSGATFTVSGVHTYIQEGAKAAKVTLIDKDGTSSATAASTGNVASAGLTVTAISSVSAIEAQTFSGTMATFTDANTGDSASQFSATIDWGDGTSSTGTVSGTGSTFTVADTHTYGDEGNFTVKVQVVDNNSAPPFTATATTSAAVADADVLTAGATTSIAATAGETFSGTVATFTDTNAAASATGFKATINWGDGTSSTGTVSGTGATFSVSGSHSYAKSGAESLSVALVDNSPGTATATAFPSAQVANSPLVATGVNVNVTQGLAASGVVVATFSDANLNDTASSFTATINWGDGVSSLGTVSGANGSFTVTGSHTYADPGHQTLNVSIAATSTSGPTASVSPTAVIGSQNDRFVGQLYRDLLAREAEAAGFEFWTGRLSQGFDRAWVILGFEQAIEFRDDVASELYSHYLNRPADAAGLATVANALLTNSVEHEAATLASSAEFFNGPGGGTPNGFLSALYQDALSRPIDAAAKAQFGAMNLSDPAVRAQVADQVFGSSEYLTNLLNSPSQTPGQYNSGVPTGFFQTFLHRNADSAGLAADLALLQAGHTELQVLQSTLASDEFFAKL